MGGQRRCKEVLVRGVVMIRVLIVCSWGMSTSLLVDSMLAAAKERNYELTVEALSAGEYAEKVDVCDVVLIAPQIRHLRKSIEKLAASVGKPVAMIEPFHYATMNGQAVLEQVLHFIAADAKRRRGSGVEAMDIKQT
ncbi:MAG: PTS sugar transporter subunit IIB [Chloroflexi bacterium]|nr:MAG: PTS sugar transporter subunit IIB [Chloroflexota bacterium]